ncbi:uncharacterized protein LOC115624063 [Scaptodrosophila lebanonensis]|uniref:Trimethylguanosine synthase n=1 Tax=Drosophila lebanonensis TaxID=7225 RepID=A0A6J2TET7_DROLE|nr:uncharacterized protein LOC115624063 [Scaptodrosophila lebanonensis]
MNTHFLTTSCHNPHFYIFTQQFDTLVHQNVESLLTKWEETQQAAWISFWEREANEFLEEEWNKRYPEYKEQIAYATLEEQQEWQELWQQHTTEVSGQFWHIFSCAFENYQRELTKSLEGNENDVAVDAENLPRLDLLQLTHKKRTNKYKQRTSDEEYWTANDDPDDVDEEQLKLFGLPTAFGTQKNRKSNKKPIIVSVESGSESDLNMPKDSEEALHGVQNPVIRKKRKDARKFVPRMPEFMREDNQVRKYWFKRFSLFSRFDHGIRLDRESWFSVTPEKIAKQTARRLSCDIILDAFCGCGGNAIQFANTCEQVIAIDIDEKKLAMAKHNAAIYGVAHKIQFVHADFLKFALSTRLRPDVVFLSPPWGGPDYLRQPSYDIEKCLQPVGAAQLLQLARQLSPNVSCFFPRNANMQQLIRLAGVGQQCEVEHNFLDTRLVAITAYYGQRFIKPLAVPKSQQNETSEAEAEAPPTPEDC